jgi:hypothetical protein
MPFTAQLMNRILEDRRHPRGPFEQLFPFMQINRRASRRNCDRMPRSPSRSPADLARS